MIKKIISNPLFVGAVGGLIANFLSDVAKKYGDISMDFLYKYFWTGVWPIWIGLAIALIYWFVRFQINVYRLYKYYGVEVGNRVKKLENEVLKYNVRIQYLEKVSAKMWDLEKTVEGLKLKKDVHVYCPKTESKE